MKPLAELLHPIRKLRMYTPAILIDLLDQAEANITGLFERLQAPGNAPAEPFQPECNCPPKQCEAAYGGHCAHEDMDCVSIVPNGRGGYGFSVPMAFGGEPLIIGNYPTVTDAHRIAAAQCLRVSNVDADGNLIEEVLV